VPRSGVSLCSGKMNHQSLLFRTGARQAQLALQAASMKLHHVLFAACVLKREVVSTLITCKGLCCMEALSGPTAVGLTRA